MLHACQVIETNSYDWDIDMSGDDKDFCRTFNMEKVKIRQRPFPNRLRVIFAKSGT
jgi:hypothetical protein